jgi:hypothetical protein
MTPPTHSTPRPAAVSAHVRGDGAYALDAGFALRLGARVVDGSLAILCFFSLHRALGLSPVPNPGWIAGVGLPLLSLWAVGRWLWDRTPGDAAWRLRAESPAGIPPGIAARLDQATFRASLRTRLRRPRTLSLEERMTAIVLTALALGAAAWSFDRAVLKQPLWARAETTTLQASLPPLSGEHAWEVMPFFYALGAWPREYGGHAVLYSLPYEKGPPERFVGHVIAHWEAPGTVVTFEGPKTPRPSVAAREPGGRTPRDRIRECLIGDGRSWECLKIRESTLLRHLTDLQRRLTGRAGGDTALAIRWQLKWFTVRNPGLPPAEEAQGIYLSAVTRAELRGGARDGGGRPASGAVIEPKGEERYVLITENGTHQAISLDYPDPDSPAGETARETFRQAIRSLRASDELGPGRAWVDKELSALELGGNAGPGGSPSAGIAGGDPAIAALLAQKPLPAGTDPARVIAKLAQAQALLLAKISVQPSIYDSFFHLGGTALLLDRIARSGARAGSLEGLELAARARPMVLSAYRYAKDLAPRDPRTTQLEGFWLEAQKR